MALASCRECGQQVSTEAHSCPHCGVPSPTQSEEWIQLERKLDAIYPNGGKLAMRIKQNIEAKRGKIKTIKEVRDQDRSLGLKEALVMYEVVEAHLRYAARSKPVERPAQPKSGSRRTAVGPVRRTANSKRSSIGLSASAFECDLRVDPEHLAGE